MLEKCGYRARVAENGLQALQALTERSYAAVLMDCQMPELDGCETTREIRAGDTAWRHVPVIAMTANSMRGERERCLAAGMDDYLSKPLRNQTLKDTLRRWVAEPRITATTAPGPTRSTTAAGEAALVDEAVIDELDFDADALTALLSLYFDQAAGLLAELTDAISRGATRAIAETAHKLKGSSGTIGAARVARLASELEAQADAGSLAGAGQLVDLLRTGLAETRDAFDSTKAFPTSV